MNFQSRFIGGDTVLSKAINRLIFNQIKECLITTQGINLIFVSDKAVQLQTMHLDVCVRVRFCESFIFAFSCGA